jgi:hypothetical protein
MDGCADLAKIESLFAEDFDLPAGVAESKTVEPVFSADELAAARDAAWHDGYSAGLHRAAEGEAAATRQAISAIAEQFAAECDAAAKRAEAAAEAIARLLLDSLAAAFPALCARYGDAEARAVVRAVVPALTQEPMIAVRANPHTAATLAREIARLEPDLAAHIQTVECEAMPPGDVRIGWRSGSATRDAAALWEQVAVVLAPAGLLGAETAIKETIDGG